MKIFYYLSIGFDIQGPSYHLMSAKVLKSLEAGYEVFVLCQKSTKGDPKIPNEFLKFPNFKYAAVYIAQPKKSQFALRYLASLKCAWDSRKYLQMGGVTIGNGAVIGAGSIVTKDIPSYAIVGGVPAKIIRYRYTEDFIKRLEKSKWWNLDAGVLKSNIELFQTPLEKDNLEDLIKLCNSVKK